MEVNNVLMVSAEVSPFAKTGGLGDVVGSLPRYLNNLGLDCRVIMPLYSTIDNKFRKDMQYLGYIYVDLGWRHQYCGIFYLEYKGVKHYFLDNEFYFKGDKLYDDRDLEKFSFLSVASFEVCKFLDFHVDVIHVHDWHSAAMCALLNDKYCHDPFFYNTKSVVTIHNIAYQGIYSKNDVLSLLPLDGNKYQNTETINLLALGLTYAYKITTVSPTYAQEILRDEYGEGLQYLLRQERDKIVGILNGIDTTEYNSKTDDKIYYNFTKSNFKEGKEKNKIALLEDIGMDASEASKPLIGVVSRLVSQKGLNLLIPNLIKLVDSGINFVILGTGDNYIENQLKFFNYLKPNNIKIFLKFDNVLAHRIYAGCDFVLMPSAFEPCGLAQMIALRYGTLPIVRSCGGLHDSITPFNEYENTGNGFSFNNFSTNDLFNTVLYANSIYLRKDKLDVVIKNGLACDFSWEKSAKKYRDLYNSL